MLIANGILLSCQCWPINVRSDERLTLETSALKLLTVANLRYQRINDTKLPYENRKKMKNDEISQPERNYCFPNCLMKIIMTKNAADLEKWETNAKA